MKFLEFMDKEEEVWKDETNLYFEDCEKRKKSERVINTLLPAL